MKAFWALLLALVLAVPAAAHQQKLAITTIEHNPRTGLIEVIHRIPLHDAEHALRQQQERGQGGPERGGASADIVSDPDSRRQFALYVTDRFSIAFEGELIDLTTLGSEIEGGHLLVYQEAPSPGLGAELSVRSAILTDIWPTQVNRVNVGAANTPVTLIFRARDQAKSVVLQ